jgi:hypothetical protein
MDYAPQKSKDWNTGYLAGLDVGYAAGYKAGLQRAVAVCKNNRNDYNKHIAGKVHTPVGDMATVCATSIQALIEELDDHSSDQGKS